MANSRRNSGAFAGTVLSIILITVSAAVIYARLPYVATILRLDEHAALWKSYRESEKSITKTRILYRDGEAFTAAASVPAAVSDELHRAAEAAITPVTETEREMGLESFVPEDTRLIGIAEKDGYIFIDLSEEMENADERAYRQIEESLDLSLDFRQMIFMIEGELLAD